jgi:hypothetical protein
VYAYAYSCTLHCISLGRGGRGSLVYVGIVARKNQALVRLELRGIVFIAPLAISFIKIYKLAVFKLESIDYLNVVRFCSIFKSKSVLH